MWMFGWVAFESYKQFPNALTSSQVARRLGVSRSTALRLRRRWQLFCQHALAGQRDQFRQELADTFKDFRLPPGKKADLREALGDRKPVNVDSMVVFSASQRAAKGRKRHKHGGLSASIYNNDRLGGEAIGSMYECVTFAGGPVFLTSVGSRRMNEVQPVIEDLVPSSAVVFTDQEYTYLNHLRNHRMVNHSAKSKDKRYKWARNRWVTEQGVHCQAAEGTQGSFKQWCRGFRYFNPRFSNYYGGEFSAIRNFKYFGLLGRDKEDLITTGALTASARKSSGLGLGIQSSLSLSVFYIKSTQTAQTKNKFPKRGLL